MYVWTLWRAGGISSSRKPRQQRWRQAWRQAAVTSLTLHVCTTGDWLAQLPSVTSSRPLLMTSGHRRRHHQHRTSRRRRRPHHRPVLSRLTATWVQTTNIASDYIARRHSPLSTASTSSMITWEEIHRRGAGSWTAASSVTVYWRTVGGECRGVPDYVLV